MQITATTKPETHHLFALIALCIEEAEDNNLRETAKKMLEVVPVFQNEIMLKQGPVDKSS